MGRSSTTEKIIVIGLTVFAVVLWGYVSLTMGQTRLRGVPMVQDKIVERTDSLSVVDKDEIQRITRELVRRIQKLENKVTVLEDEISDLRKKIEGG